MSSTSLTPSLAELTADPPRRVLSPRQVTTVDRLTSAAEAELKAEGYDALTVRKVAKRAGVAPATAYTYFSSKDHLVAEVYWRRLQALPAPRVDRRRGAASRVSAVLRDVTLLVADEPELTAACTTALLATDPDVGRLRARIGQAVSQRLRAALGEGIDPAAARALELALSGALLQASMGHLAYTDLPAQMEEVAAVVLGGAR